ncbi:hypothetical protein E2C01_046014 [Portunus trituberculatus]|uniref:Uncharacterized protein n=1 Tax=Portunus trituberculatus TaxID=210409 RepID=A0A5B7FZT4_PORTR|nr:hypothetical protein [Portunus trituberculatus]
MDQDTLQSHACLKDTKKLEKFLFVLCNFPFFSLNDFQPSQVVDLALTLTNGSLRPCRDLVKVKHCKKHTKNKNKGYEKW